MFTAGDEHLFPLPRKSSTELEEEVLRPLRVPSNHSRASRASIEQPVLDFDPGSMKADTLELVVELAPSVLNVYACAIVNLYNLKVRRFSAKR